MGGGTDRAGPGKLIRARNTLAAEGSAVPAFTPHAQPISEITCLEHLIHWNKSKNPLQIGACLPYYLERRLDFRTARV